MTLSTLKKRVAGGIVAASLVAVAGSAFAEEKDQALRLTHDEFVTNIQVRNMTDCFTETERFIKRATAIFRAGSNGQEPPVDQVNANRERRNKACEERTGITAEESRAFGTQLQEKYGNDLPKILFKYMPKGPSVNA